MSNVLSQAGSVRDLNDGDIETDEDRSSTEDNLESDVEHHGDDCESSNKASIVARVAGVLGTPATQSAMDGMGDNAPLR